VWLPVADEWEDWEDETFEPKLQAGAAANGQKFETKGQAVLASVKEPDQSKFAGEDEEEDAPPPAWDKEIPKPQQVRLAPQPLQLGACMGIFAWQPLTCSCVCLIASGET
jgi:hypothetical protein